MGRLHESQADLLILLELEMDLIMRLYLPLEREYKNKIGIY